MTVGGLVAGQIFFFCACVFAISLNMPGDALPAVALSGSPERKLSFRAFFWRWWVARVRVGGGCVGGALGVDTAESEGVGVVVDTAESSAIMAVRGAALAPSGER